MNEQLQVIGDEMLDQVSGGGFGCFKLPSLCDVVGGVVDLAAGVTCGVVGLAGEIVEAKIELVEDLLSCFDPCSCG